MLLFFVAAGAVAIQAAALVVLAVQCQRVRKTEQEARDRVAELRASYERIRDIGARLLNAQEIERARIARELHDDIGQQLALLELNLQLGNVEASLANVKTLAASIRGLSHRLHPTRLSLLGLVEAVRSLQHELTPAPIAIAFSHTDIPTALSPTLSLCLFRVIQEAVRNAIRHSNAAKVTIDLKHDKNGLSLQIVDDGHGFDVHAALRTGLGLISMRERVEGVGGVLVIRSQAGAGTKVEVRVPIENSESVSTGLSMTNAGSASRLSFDTHHHRERSGSTSLAIHHVDDREGIDGA
jgi:signal transduction histidine kinase